MQHSVFLDLLLKRAISICNLLTHNGVVKNHLLTRIIFSRNARDALSALAKSGKAPVSSEQALSMSQQIGAAVYVETSARASVRTAVSAFEVAALAAMGKLPGKANDPPSPKTTFSTKN